MRKFLLDLVSLTQLGLIFTVLTFAMITAFICFVIFAILASPFLLLMYILTIFEDLSEK
jgi:hypothetical protein